MFTNENFDLDEDFLKEISQKEPKQCSQALSSDEERSIKRFKNNKDDTKQSYINHPTSNLNSEKLIPSKTTKDSLVQKTNDIGGIKSVRTNLILGRLKRNETTTSDQSIHHRVDETINRNSNPAEMNVAEESFSQKTNDQSRKNVICERLRKHVVKGVSTRPNSLKENRNSNNSNDSKSTHLEANEKSQLKLMTTCHKPAVLPQQFPGPAGLLPHLSGGIIPSSIPESLFSDNSNRNSTDVVDNTSITSKYCSRNITNSISDKAWQLLLSDLSPNFLDGHQISTVKQRILSNSFKNDRVPILAGIVQRVDYTRLDPSVTLKDSTGIIDGTVCKDILVEYPNLLEIGVVLFLGNVGFLTIGSYPKKCHLILTSRNIINVYTCKCRILSISEMEARLQNLNLKSYLREFDKQESSSPGSPNSESECSLPIKCVRATERDEARLRFSNSENSGQKESRTSVLESKNLSKNNDSDSASFQGNTNSLQCTVPMDNKSTFESENLQDFDDDFAASFLDLNDDNLVLKAATDLDQIINSGMETHASVLMNNSKAVCKKNSALNATPSNLELPQKIELSASKASNKSNERTKIFDRTCRKDESASLATIKKSNPTKASDIKLKLSVFKNDKELTPQHFEDTDVPSVKETSKQNESSFASGLLSNMESYSDEELFSQLDVESIVLNYNRLNDVN